MATVDDSSFVSLINDDYAPDKSGAMETVNNLYSHYSRRLGDNKAMVQAELRRLTERYIDRWELTAQALACGAAVTALANTGSIDIANLDAQVREAFELAYPNVPVETLVDASPEHLAGYINAWKGKLFEVQVRDQLNASEMVGGIRLGLGQHAELAASATQPGWDLQILNDDGTIANLAQMKATESISYVREAIERYPDVHIISTTDLADHAALISTLSTADVSVGDLQRAIETPITDICDDGIWDTVLPGLPFLLIGARQGLAIFSDEKDWGEALAAAAVGGATAAIAIGGAHLASGIATEVVGELASDLIGDVAADLLLGAVLPFGVGFLLRKLLGGGSKPRPVPIVVPEPRLNEKLINDWVMPRALLVQRTVSKYYLPRSNLQFPAQF